MEREPPLFDEEASSSIVLPRSLCMSWALKRLASVSSNSTWVDGGRLLLFEGLVGLDFLVVVVVVWGGADAAVSSSSSAKGGDISSSVAVLEIFPAVDAALDLLMCLGGGLATPVARAAREGVSAPEGENVCC